MTAMAQQAVMLRDAASAAVGRIEMYKVSRYVLNLERLIKAACNDSCLQSLPFCEVAHECTCIAQGASAEVEV
jgi:hypothetical protein